jgi:hypothetical protein
MSGMLLTLFSYILFMLFGHILFSTIDRESPHPNSADPFVGQVQRGVVAGPERNAHGGCRPVRFGMTIPSTVVAGAVDAPDA